MSLSDFQHPLYVVRHPQPEPEVKQALLSRWASEHANHGNVRHEDVRKVLGHHSLGMMSSARPGNLVDGDVAND